MKTLRKEFEARLQTVEQAYQEVGESRIDFSIFPESKRKFKEAQYDIEIIIEAARKIEKEFDPKEIDWEDENQSKWRPWFSMSPSRFAFIGSINCTTNISAGSGSRLNVLKVETSDFIGKQFIEIWKAVQL